MREIKTPTLHGIRLRMNLNRNQGRGVSPTPQPIKDMEKEIYLADLYELMNEDRPTDEQRRSDLEESIGTFEDALIEALCG